MATKRAIVASWGLLEGAGLTRPWAGEDDASRALVVWLDLLTEVPDDRIVNLARAYALGSNRFWPTPGQLLAVPLPRIAPLRPQRQIEADDGLSTWRSLDGVTRMRLMDRAIDEVPKCSPSCACTCPTCADHRLARVEELAREHLRRAS